MSGSGSIRICALASGGLMRHRGDDALDQFAGVDPLRLEFAPAFAGEIEDRRDQPVHLGDRGFDEAQRFGEIFRELLVGAFEHGFGASVALSGDRGAEDSTRPRARSA